MKTKYIKIVLVVVVILNIFSDDTSAFPAREFLKTKHLHRVGCKYCT